MRSSKTRRKNVIDRWNLGEEDTFNLNEAAEDLSKQGKAVLIVAPQIRRHVSRFVRAQIPAVNVLSFTELPENRSVEIAYTIGETDPEE